MTEINTVNFETLTMGDAFLFATMMKNKPLCQKVIQTLLENPNIDDINYIEVEKQEKHSYESKGVRFDVYVKGHRGVAYVVEMQTTDTKELEKRARYYQSMADVGQLKKGNKVKYKHLKDSFVIFICREDIFGLGKYKYSFENMCSEIEGLKLGDGAYKRFFNTKGYSGNVSDDVKDFLRFIEGVKSESSFIQELNEQMEQIKKDEKWQVEYMQSHLRDQDMVDKGIEQGIEQRSIEIAKNAISEGLSDEMIAKISGLELEVIKNLYEEVNQK